MHSVINWTPEAVATLRDLWKDGVTAAEIAVALGHPGMRHAIVAKAHRLKLGHHPYQNTPAIPKVDHRKVNNPKQQSVAAARAGDVKAAPDSRFLTSSIWRAPEGTTLLAVEELTEQTCRWPYGDPREPGFGFCGKPNLEKPKVRENDPPRFHRYCKHHYPRTISKEFPQ